MKSLFPVIFILLSAQGFSKLKLPHIFGSQMVLQRDKPARIWGWADTEKEIVADNFNCRGVSSKYKIY